MKRPTLSDIEYARRKRKTNGLTFKTTQTLKIWGTPFISEVIS